MKSNDLSHPISIHWHPLRHVVQLPDAAVQQLLHRAARVRPQVAPVGSVKNGVLHQLPVAQQLAAEQRAQQLLHRLPRHLGEAASHVSFVVPDVVFLRLLQFSPLHCVRGDGFPLVN